MSKRVSNRSSKSAGTGDRKAKMVKENDTATPPANSGGSLTAEAVKSLIAESLKPITDAIAKVQPPAQQTAPAAEKKEQPLTLDAITKLLDDRDKQRDSQAQVQRDRQSFIDSKMQNLPAIYRNQLGNDPSKWAAEEQAIRQTYQTDFKASGGKVENVSGDQPSNGQKPGAVVDTSKLSPFDKITQGLKTAKSTLSIGADQAAQIAGGATAQNANAEAAK